MSRILIIGPGALGITAAVRLHQAGHEVTVAARDAAKAKRLSKQGLRLVAPDGTESTVHLPVVHAPRQMESVDLLIHTTKCHGAAKILKKWLPTLAPDGWVVPFQNGVIGDELAAVAGDRFLECSVYFPATLTSEGVSHQTAAGHLVVGPWPTGDAGPGSPSAQVAAVLDAIVPAHAHADMRAVKWSKLILNSAMTSLGVVTGQTMRGMMADKPTRQAFLAVIREGLAVMDAQGIPAVRVGASRPRLLARLPDAVAHGVLRLLARKYADYRSSSAQSLARGQKTEVDHLNGVIVAAGQEHGVPTPVNAALVAAVHAIEEGELEAGVGLVASHVLS